MIEEELGLSPTHETVQDWEAYSWANERSLRDYDGRMNWGVQSEEKSDYLRRLGCERRRRNLRKQRARHPRAEGCLGVENRRTYTRGCKCTSCFAAARTALGGPRRSRAEPIDEVAVRLVLTGQRMKLRPVEKREVVLLAVKRGETLEMISDRLHQSYRNTERQLTRLKKEGRL